jgi:uncharacterized protein (TIGR00369 family)
MSFEPKDPDFRNRVAASFQRQKAMATLGITLVDVSPGHVTLSMPRSESLTQQHGFMHAGIIATALDSACGYAAFSLMPADAAVLTVEYKINLLAPAAGATFKFCADVIKPGRTLTICDGRALSIMDGKEILIATMTGTLMAILGRPGVQH